jgi:hypothetical protein
MQQQHQYMEQEHQAAGAPACGSRLYVELS